MVPVKKTTNVENNYDVVEYDYGDLAEHFNWICLACKGKACDALSLEMQFLGDNVVYLDSDGSYWFRCENCKASVHANCLGIPVNVELFKQYGQIVKCC